MTLAKSDHNSASWPGWLAWLGIGAAALGVGVAVGQYGWLAVVWFGLVLAAWQSLSRPVWLVGLMLVLLVAGQVARMPSGGSGGNILLLDLTAGALFFMWFYYWLSFGRRIESPGQAARAIFRQPATRAWVGFLALALVALAATPLALSQKQIILNGFYWSRLLFYSSLIVIIPSLFQTKPAARRLAFWMLLVMLLVLALGFVQLYILPDIGSLARFGWDPHVGRLVSTFLDPNYLGGFLALGIALVGSRLFLGQGQPVWLWLALVLLILGVVLTYSRSGYLATALVVAALGWRFNWRVFLLAALVATPLALTVPRVNERVLGAFSLDKTSRDRIQSWQNALAISTAYPVLGVGYNNYRQAQEQARLIESQSTSRSGAGSDSSLLNVLATTGWVGFALFTLAAVLSWRQLWRWYLRRSQIDSEAGHIAAALVIFLPALFIHSWFVNSLFYPTFMAYLAILIGCLYVLAQKDQ